MNLQNSRPSRRQSRSLMLAGAAWCALASGAVPAHPAFAHPAFADPLPPAATYADLLEPVPNAMERLAADDARAAQFIPAQINVGIGVGGPMDHHHHHHHHHHSARWWRSHGYVWDGRAWIIPPRHHHHHHHHHHHAY